VSERGERNGEGREKEDYDVAYKYSALCKWRKAGNNCMNIKYLIRSLAVVVWVSQRLYF